MGGMELIGDPHPCPGDTTSLPPKLAELLKSRGEGILCGFEIAAPGSEKHKAIAARFATRDIWIEKNPRFIAIGEASDGSFLVVDPQRELLLFHRRGPIKSCGADLDDLLKTLASGIMMLIDAAGIWTIESAIKDDPSFL